MPTLISDTIVADARKQKLLEALPATHRELGASLAPEVLADFVARVNAPPPPGPATPDEIRANIGKRGWLEANRDRLGMGS